MRHFLDAIAIGVPRRSLDEDPATITAAIDRLNATAQATLDALYPHVRLVGVEWTFAFSPADVEAWPLPHDCDECRECKTRSIAALNESDDVFVALGTMYCEER